jgi:hypothetical protein
MKKYCILLTGTIKPDAVLSLGRTDALQREKDYYEAVNHWIKKGIPVVFCENSNYDSELISSISEPGFEFIQYKEFADLSLKGKGYGEFNLMKFAFENSKFIEEADTIIKVTGRLIVKNFNSILRRTENWDFDILSPLEVNLAWSDSRFIVFKKSFFTDYFVKKGEEINDSTGYCFERALASAIHYAIGDGKKWEMIPVYPNYIGFSGTNNQKYTLFKYEILKKLIKFPLFRFLLYWK